MKEEILLMSILVLLVATGCGGAPPARPETPPVVPPLLLADFATCLGENSLGGAVGAAYQPPDLLQEKYVKAEDGGCYAQLDYTIGQWAALYLQWPDADLTPYTQLAFDIKAEPQPGMTRPTVKLEFKKRNGEVSTLDVKAIGSDWQTRTVRLADFGPSYGKPISSWKGISEFVVVVEQAKAGREGTILLDNITLK